MATCTEILPPPQSVDTLDAWGSLDELPWSLDSGLWLAAGVYGIVAEASGQAGGELAAWNRIRAVSLTHGAATEEEAEGHVVRSLVLSGTAGMGGDQIGGVVRAIPVGPLVAKSGEAFELHRVRTEAFSEHTRSGEELGPYRVRTGSSEAAAQSGEHFVPCRILTLHASGMARSGQGIFPEYKGWGWIRQESGNAQWRGVVQWQ